MSRRLSKVKKTRDSDSLVKDTSTLAPLDYGEISEEFKVVAESVAEWGEKIYEEEVFPLFVTLSTFSVPDLLPWLHQTT
jgi:hypothetical protein